MTTRLLRIAETQTEFKATTLYTKAGFELEEDPAMNFHVGLYLQI